MTTLRRSMNFILSNNILRLENYFLDEISKIENEAEAYKGAIVITPEQFTHEVTTNIAKKLDDGIMFYTNIHSFTSFTKQFTNEFGEVGNIVNNTGKKIILQKAIFDVKNELVFYGKVCDKVSFVETMMDTIDELIDTKTSLETIKEIYESDDGKSYLSLKLKDIYLIYSKFNQFFEENNYLLNQNSLEQTAEILYKEQWEYLKNKKIYLYGFNGFLKREMELLKGIIYNLKELNSDVSLLLTIDEKTNLKKMQKGEYYLRDFDPYFEPKRTLIDFFNMINSIEEKKIDYYIVELFEKNEIDSYLKGLQVGFFDNKFTLPMDKPILDNVKVVGKQNKNDEVRYIVNAIHRNIIENDLKYNDFIIMCSDIDSYSLYLKKIFDSFEIPYYIDKKDSILKYELVKFIFNIFDLYLYNFSYEIVFDMLKNDFCSFLKRDELPITTSDIELLENYVLKYNIRGNSYKKPFKYLNGFNAEEDELNEYATKELEKIDKIREGFIENVIPFENFTKDNFVVKDFLEVLYNFLLKSGLEKELQRRFNLENQEQTIFEASQIWDYVIDVFEKIIELVGDSKVSFSDMRKLIEIGFSDKEFGYVPNNKDVVKVVDLYRSRFSATKHMFIIGAVEGLYPKYMGSKTFFDDDDIEQFKEKNIMYFTDSFMHMNIQNLNVYNAINKTLESLVISYPIANVNGDGNKYSMLIARVVKMLGIEVDSSRTVNTLSLGEVLTSILQKEAKDQRDIKLLEKVENELNRINISVIEKIFNKEFSQSIIADYTDFVVNDNQYKTSISKIETYNDCPYKHFMKYDLSLKPREQYEVSAIDFGNIYHKMLEEFFNYLKENNISMNNLSDNFIEQYIDDNIAMYSKSREDDILNSTAQFRYYVKNITKILKRSTVNFANQFYDRFADENITQNPFLYEESELEIKEKFTSSKGYDVSYKGIVDRVDIKEVEDEVFVRVVDYKSSEKAININNLIEGKNLQLLKYLELIVKDKSFLKNSRFDNKNFVPGGAVYSILKDIEFSSKGDDKNLYYNQAEEFAFKGLINEETKDFYPQGYLKNVIGSDRNAKTKKISRNDFDLMLKYADYKVKDSVDRILDGSIKVSPIAKSLSDDNSTCIYCDYSSICKIKDNDKFKRIIRDIDKESNEITEKQKKYISKEIDKDTK